MKSSLAEDIRPIPISRKIEGSRVGKIVEVEENGSVLVDFSGNNQGPVAARFTSSFQSKILQENVLVGQEVLLVFEDNNQDLPIIIDILHSSIVSAEEKPKIIAKTEEIDDVLVDGRRVTFEAKEEIVLRCGKSSITLTRAGKVLIRGAYLLNRSSGVNRIKGGSVQIN